MITSSSRGFGLIELIVAVALSATVAVAVTGLSISSLRHGREDQGRQAALGLAEGALEASVNLARDRWSTLPAAGIFHPAIESGTGAWSLSPGPETIALNGIDYTRQVEISDVSRAQQSNGRSIGDIVTTGGYVDTGTKLATATVSWSAGTGGTRTVTLRDYLVRWPMKAWDQASWAGGPGQTTWSDITRYASNDSNISSIGATLALTAGTGSGPVSGGTTNPEFTTDTSGWTFAAWGAGGGANGTWISAAGNPGGYTRIRLNDRNRTFGGYWYQPVAVTADTLTAATAAFDWSIVHYNASATGLRAYVFLDTTAAAPTLGQQVWSSPVITGTTSWASVTGLDVASKITGPGTYYLKLAFYGTFGSGNQDARVGFDNASLAWSGTSGSAGTIYPTQGTMDSSTFDIGTGAEFLTLSWTGSTPTGTSLAFQVATSDDGTSWSFTGPDGTAATEYQTSGALIHPVVDGRRYARYRAFLRTSNTSVTPTLSGVRMEYSP